MLGRHQSSTYSPRSRNASFSTTYLQFGPANVVTGVNFIFYFGALFFKAAGIENAFAVNCIMGGVNVFCTLPGMYLIEKIGRRKLLLYGAAVQCISHFLVGIIYRATDGTKPIFTVIFSATFIAAFAASWGPCAWVISAELFGL